MMGRGRHVRDASLAPAASHRTLRIADLLFCALFALSVAVGSRIIFTNGVVGTIDETALAPIGAGTVALFAAFFCVTALVLHWLRRHEEAVLGVFAGEPGEPVRVKPLLVTALVLLVAWSPYLLALCPGAILPDTTGSIDQILGYMPLSSHHPVVFTLLLGLFMKAPIPVGITGKVYLFSLFQASCLALTMAYLLLWLRKRGLGGIGCALAFVYVAFVPVFPVYAMSVQKDTLFSVFAVLLSLRLAEFGAQDGEDEQSLGLREVALVLLMVGVAVMRGNGMLAAAGSAAALVLLGWRHPAMRRRAFAVVAGFAVCFAVTFAVLGRIALATESAEWFGVPLQQLSRTIALDGPMSEEDRSFMNQVMPLEDYRQVYTPALVDSVKWSPRFNESYLSEHKGEFVRLWARNLPANLGTYVDAYILDTFGYWAPGFRSDYGYLDTYVVANGYGIERRDLFAALFGGTLAQNITKSPEYLASGTLLWLVLFGAWLAYAYRKPRFVALLFVPALFSFAGIMVASPVAFSLRYVLAFAFGLPAYLGVGLTRVDRE